MTPEFVAEGFYRLVTQCSNGSAMAVLNGDPYMLVPDYNQPMIMIMVIISRMVEKILGPEVVTTNHQILCFAFLFLLMGGIMAWLL